MNYLDFKIGEVWAEVGEELDHEILRPTSPDVELLEIIQSQVQDKVQGLLSVQTEINIAESETSRNRESQFFKQWFKVNAPSVQHASKKRIHTWRRGKIE